MPISFDILNDDVLYLVCSFLDHETLASITLVNKRLRQLASPFLFRSIILPRKPWEQILVLADALQVSDGILGHVKTFHLQPDIKDMPEKSLALFFGCLVRIMSMMRNMTTLDASIGDELINSLEARFEASQLSLPAVRTLYIGRGSAFIIRHCPNMEKLSTASFNGERFDWSLSNEDEIIKAAGRATKLSHVALGNFYWRPKNIARLAAALPRISSLVLMYDMSGFAGAVPRFSGFKELRHLTIPDLETLNVGYEPPHCGNAYDDNPGLAKRLEIICREKGDMVAEKLFAACAKLEELRFGLRPSSMRYRRGADGVIKRIH